MLKLSVVVITFNEEKNIGRCIESVKDIADEILVIDSFSKDKTEEICNSYGVRFEKHAFEGYIEQKEYALRQATYDHVLSLDADEALDETLAQEVVAAKKNWNADVFSMNRLTNYCGKWVRHSGWYPDVKVRLVDRTKVKWGGINPHDELISTAGKLEQKHLKGDMLHYSFYTPEEHYKQIENFSTIGAKAYYDKGKRSNLLKLAVNPAIKFLKDYLVKRGFMDGALGFRICYLSAGATYKKYRKLYQLQQEAKNGGN